MKLLQKSLMFASLLVVTTGAVSIPAISGNGVVHAASTQTTKIKNLTADGFYYRVSKDQLIKASDVEILTNDNETDANMIETAVANNFRLQVTVKKAPIYNLKGKKTNKCLTKDTVCTIGSQDAFNNSTYYQTSKNKLVQVNDSTWL